MTIINAKIVLKDSIIENGYISISDGVITEINRDDYKGNDDVVDAHHKVVMPGFIDVHIHGSSGIDFMDANEDDYITIANALYKEGVTTFLATTLTSDNESLSKVCKTVKNVINKVPSLGGVHFEGPYISEKYKGAQNPEFIRNPNIKEFDELNELSGNNVRYITLAPEKEGAKEFIKHVSSKGVVVSAGHTDASFKEIEESINVGLTNTTHTHNAMSGHHHRNPGVVTAAFNFDELYTEFICDGKHVCPDTLKTSYKIIGPKRFIVVTDALKAKHSDINEFDLFGLPCVKKDGAAYLKSGPLAGSLLTMDQAMRNMHDYCNCSLNELANICSGNAARAIHLEKRGEIKVGNYADLVMLDEHLNVISTYKNGKKVF